MDEEDYFGHITVPDIEEDDDAANDLTFGDIGDITAGDDSSDAFWKLDHHTLSRRIEEEKQALQQSRPPSASLARPTEDPHNNRMPVPKAMPTSSFSDSPLTRLLQEGHQNQDPSKADHVKATQQHHSHPSPSNSRRRSQPLNSRQQVSPVSTGPLPMNPQDYEKVMISYYEQQVREALQRQKKTAEHQLREAIAAQRAGVIFDRSKFDDHQESSRQRILNEYYSRVNQIRYHAWLQAQKSKEQETFPQRPGMNSQENDFSGSKSRSQHHIIEMERKYAHQSKSPTVSADVSNPVTGLRANGQSELVFPVVNRHGITDPNGRAANAVPAAKDSDHFVSEATIVTRTMLKPSVQERKLVSVVERETRSSVGRESKNRRLESMTDKDQELVFRAYLRQVESVVTYKDDFYSGVYQRNRKLGVEEIYSDLAKKVQEVRLRHRLQRLDGRSLRARRSKRIVLRNEHQTSLASQTSESTMRNLANALGSVQTWNPKAPRRVMDFSAIDRRKQKRAIGSTKLLRDDERVQVRLEIERGYDIIAVVHDIVRGESPKSLEDQIKLLLETLRIEGKQNEKASHLTRISGLRFFRTLCVLGKGRRYLARVLEILDIAERISVMPSIFESLGAMCFSLHRCKQSRNCTENPVVTKALETINDSETSALDCMRMLNTFASSHESHPDAFLTTFRSAQGAKLMFACMQRVAKGMYREEIAASDISRGNIDKLAGVFTEMLQNIFEGAELVNRVWEVTGSLHNLVVGEVRSTLRTELNRLLRIGAVPPPPTA